MTTRPAAAALLFLLLAAPPSPAGDSDAVLTTTLKTEHLDLHVRPGSRAAASLERTAAAAERDLARITDRLELRLDARIHLYIYDDLDELARISGTPGTGGFTWADQVHIPWDDDQTRIHELVHAVAHRIPRAGNERRSGFFADGLANAVLEHVHGVPVHAVAAFYRRRKELPPLAEITGAPDFYAWLREHPGFNAYDVGGSFLLHLLDGYGAEKVKRYYGGLAAKKAFGADFAALEKSWHRFLDRFDLRPEVETLLRQRAGEEVAFTRWEPDFAAVLGKPGDWTSLLKADLRPADGKTWSREGGAVTGRSAGGAWRVCEFGTKPYGDAAVRAKVDLSGGCGALQVRLGPGCQGMLVANGAFVWRDGGATASNPLFVVGGRGEVDLVLLRRGGTAEVWVDGKLAARGPCGTEPALPGVAFVNGTAVIRSLSVRGLK